MKNIFFFFIVFILSKCLLAQKHDTLTLVKVNAIKEKVFSSSSTPIQLLNNTQLQKINSISIADALKQFAGVQVKDYGGIGGLKTISVRSLGANHTGILYDGINIADAQSGQIDMGKFSLDNVAELKLYNSLSSEILLPARAFSSASLITIKTIPHILAINETQLLKVKMQYGSFGFFSPSILFKQKIADKLQIGFNVFYQSAISEYPYISYENTTLIEKRKNSDIKATRAEFDIAYFKSDSNKFFIKSYYYNSKRGLPGAIILYNNTSSQRLNDENFFTQICWQKKWNNQNEFLLNSKFALDKNYYLDPNYPNSYKKLENEFHQKEIYFSAAYKHIFSKIVSISYASDYFNSNLKRTDFLADTFATPSRNTFINNVALFIKKSRFEVAANLLHTNITEKVVYGKNARNISQFSPSISASVLPFKIFPLYVRAFYKQIFRSPTFNDLYYTNIGNTNLKPEVADQFNIGFNFSKTNFSFLKTLSISTDFYYNKVTDKILAIPRQNLFQWSMQNIGKVNIKGLDATLHIQFKEIRQIFFSSNISYTYQQSLDVSDATSNAFNTQLPYTPKHSGSINFTVDYKNASLSYNLLASSYRYRQGDAIPENLLRGWLTHDFTFAYSIYKRYKFLAEANNIFNTQYEIIKYYPMPRINYRLTLLATFKTQKKS